jgi:FKBP-type peptidyl-prolyl cis-trans isomerase 2
MRTNTTKRKAPELYTGEKVKVKSGGKIVNGEVVEVGEGEVCIDFGGGDVRWVSTSTIVR